MTSPLWIPPEGTLDSSSNAMHEMFLSYVRAGFTEDQALKLIALVIVNAKAPEENDDSQT